MTGLIIPASVAGLWIGACLGDRGIFRAMLRGVLVGAIEGAGSVAIMKETLTQNEALQHVLNLIYINALLFWFFSLISSAVSDITTISEQDWQTGTARRAFIKRVVRSLWQRRSDATAKSPAQISKYTYFNKTQSYYRKIWSWSYDVLILTFSRENIARHLLSFFVILAVILILWIRDGISVLTAFEFLLRNRIGVK